MIAVFTVLAHNTKEHCYDCSVHGIGSQYKISRRKVLPFFFLLFCVGVYGLLGCLFVCLFFRALQSVLMFVTYI